MTAQRRRVQNNNVIPKVLIGIGLLFLGVTALLLLGRESSNINSMPSFSVPAKVNYRAPEFHLTDLEGNSVSLADYRGQVLLVNNWATWCPPCQAEMPELVAFYQAYRQQGFTIVAIESGETQGEVQAFADQYGLTFPIWLDPEAQALRAFQFTGLPSSYVIDRQGQVRLAWAGAITYDIMERYIPAFLKE